MTSSSWSSCKALAAATRPHFSGSRRGQPEGTQTAYAPRCACPVRRAVPAQGRVADYPPFELFAQVRVAHYVVERKEFFETLWTPVATFGKSTATTRCVRGLQAAQVYHFRVFAVSPSGAVGDPSEPVMAVTRPEPLAYAEEETALHIGWQLPQLQGHEYQLQWCATRERDPGELGTGVERLRAVVGKKPG